MRALLCKAVFVPGRCGGFQEGCYFVVLFWFLVFFSKTTILNGHFGNRVKPEIVFTFGKGFKEETKKEAACGCGL